MRIPVKRAVTIGTLYLGVALPAQAPVEVAPIAFEPIAPGVGYARLERAAGPWVAHIVRVDRAAGPWTVVARHAGDSVRSRETTSAMAARLAAGQEVVAALNADFFDLRTGEVTDHQVIDGVVWKAIPGFPVRTGRWRSRGQFAIAADGTRAIRRFRYAGRLAVAGRDFVLDGVNLLPPNGTALVHFDDRWGTLPVADSAHRAVADTTVQGLRLVAYDAAGRARLDSVIAAVRRRWWPDARLRLTHRFAAGDPPARASEAEPSAMRSGTQSPPRDRDEASVASQTIAVPQTLVGGWGVLVRDGRDVADSTDAIERTAPSLSAQRHPRSAIGTSDGGRVLWLIAVDGRQASSVGMTFRELAALMRDLGIEEGLNLDGGGSTALWVAGAVRNRPSDPTGERTVGNALFVVRR